MTISIIGGAGFVGTRLSHYLTRNEIEHRIYDINTVSDEHFFIDVTEPESLDALNMSQTLINLAAVHRDDIKPLSRYDEVNVVGARNICDCAIKFNINKIIFASSVAIYGFAPANTDEKGIANYFNDYGRTKYLAEQVYKNWQAGDPGNRTLVIVRPTVIFGEGNRGNVYNLLKQIASKRFVMVGDGKNKKSMAYVENVAAFLHTCLLCEKGLHIYNYIDKPDLDMNTLVAEARNTLFGQNDVGFRLPGFLAVAVGFCADVLSQVVGRSLPVSSIRVKKFMGTTQFASSISDADFTPPVSLKDGLARTLRYEFLEDNSGKQTFESE